MFFIYSISSFVNKMPQEHVENIKGKTFIKMDFLGKDQLDID